MPSRARDEGSTTLELAILFPVLLLVVTALVQYGLWFHARSVALAAAQEGVSAARVLGRQPRTPGRSARRPSSATTARTRLLDVSVQVTDADAGDGRHRGSGRSLSLLPGVPGPTVPRRRRPTRALHHGGRP